MEDEYDVPIHEDYPDEEEVPIHDSYEEDPAPPAPPAAPEAPEAPRFPLENYKPEEKLYLIKGTNVVFSCYVWMVIGFVYREVLIRAPIHEVREVCKTYRLEYFGDHLKALGIEEW